MRIHSVPAPAALAASTYSTTWTTNTAALPEDESPPPSQHDPIMRSLHDDLPGELLLLLVLWDLQCSFISVPVTMSFKTALWLDWTGTLWQPCHSSFTNCTADAVLYSLEKYCPLFKFYFISLSWKVLLRRIIVLYLKFPVVLVWKAVILIRTNFQEVVNTSDAHLLSHNIWTCR